MVESDSESDHSEMQEEMTGMNVCPTVISFDIRMPSKAGNKNTCLNTPIANAIMAIRDFAF